MKPLDDIEIPDWAGPFARRWSGDAWPVSVQGNGVTFEGATVADAVELADDAAKRGHLVNAREGRTVTIFRPAPHRRQ